MSFVCCLPIFKHLALLLPCRHFWPLNSPIWGPVRKTSQSYSQKKSKSRRSRLQRHHQLSAISSSLFKCGADCRATINSQLSRRLCSSVEQTAAPPSTLSYLFVFVSAWIPLQLHHQLSVISPSLFKHGADCSATINSQLSHRLCLSVEQTAAPPSTLSYLVVFV